MKTTTYPTSNNPRHVLHDAASVHIEATRSEVEGNTNMTTGLFVGDVDVDNEDGTYTRFHLYLRITKQGRAAIEVSTNDRTGTKSTVKKLVGVKKGHPERQDLEDNDEI